MSYSISGSNPSLNMIKVVVMFQNGASSGVHYIVHGCGNFEWPFSSDHDDIIVFEMWGGF